MRTVALNSENQTLVTGGEDGFVRLWQISRSEEGSRYELKKKFEENKHESRINSTMFSSSGKFIVSTSDDQKVKLWNVESESFVKDFTEHQNSVRYALFSSDEKIIASASDDGTVRLWNVNTEHHIILREQDNHRRMWCVSSRTNLKLTVRLGNRQEATGNRKGF